MERESLIQNDLSSSLKDLTLGEKTGTVVMEGIVGNSRPRGQSIVDFASFEGDDDLVVPVVKGDSAKGPVKRGNGEFHYCTRKEIKRRDALKKKRRELSKQWKGVSWANNPVELNEF